MVDTVGLNMGPLVAPMMTDSTRKVSTEATIHHHAARGSGRRRQIPIESVIVATMTTTKFSNGPTVPPMMGAAAVRVS